MKNNRYYKENNFEDEITFYMGNAHTKDIMKFFFENNLNILDCVAYCYEFDITEYIFYYIKNI